MRQESLQESNKTKKIRELEKVVKETTKTIKIIDKVSKITTDRILNILSYDKESIKNKKISSKAYKTAKKVIVSIIYECKNYPRYILVINKIDNEVKALNRSSYFKIIEEVEEDLRTLVENEIDTRKRLKTKIKQGICKLWKYYDEKKYITDFSGEIIQELDILDTILQIFKDKNEIEDTIEIKAKGDFKNYNKVISLIRQIIHIIHILSLNLEELVVDKYCKINDILREIDIYLLYSEDSEKIISLFSNFRQNIKLEKNEELYNINKYQREITLNLYKIYKEDINKLLIAGVRILKDLKWEYYTITLNKSNFCKEIELIIQNIENEILTEVKKLSKENQDRIIEKVNEIKKVISELMKQHQELISQKLDMGKRKISHIEKEIHKLQLELS